MEKLTLKPDIAICHSADHFIKTLLEGLSGFNQDYSNWIGQCQDLSSKFSIMSEDYQHKTQINPYLFIHQFSEHLQEDEIIVYDGGSIMNYVMQAFQLKRGQRLICSTGLELPGFSVPGAIGVSQWSNDKPIYCLCEGQGAQLSLTELQTIATYQLPIKIMNFHSLSLCIYVCLQRIHKLFLSYARLNRKSSARPSFYGSKLENPSSRSEDIPKA